MEPVSQDNSKTENSADLISTPLETDKAKTETIDTETVGSTQVENDDSPKMFLEKTECETKVDTEKEVKEDEDEEDEDDDDDDDDNNGGTGSQNAATESSEEEEEKVTEDEYEPPQKTVRKPNKPPARKIMKVRTPGCTDETSSTPSSSKRRGRPAKAPVENSAKEPDKKRERRKPNRLKDAASEEEESEDTDSKKKRKPKEDTSDSESDKGKKVQRRRKQLTEKEIEEREAERKRKYHENKAIAKAKKEARVAYFVMKREEKKAKVKEEKRLRAEHEQRMAELKAQYLDDAADGSGGSGTPAPFFFDESSQSSLKPSKKKWGDVGVLEMSGIHNPLAHVNADTLFEYKWPPEGRHAEHFFLQEQVTEYLHVKSFRRKYPDCPRRNVDMDERDFLREMKIVNETQADLGLTAIPSSAVLDIMCQDFYDKYEAYMTVMNERKDRKLRNSNYSSGGGDLKVGEAAKIAAEYNKRLNQERRERRSAYFDMQTFCVHYPKNGKGRMRVLKKPKLGNYPVAMIPGQFVDSYKSYNSKELNYFPLNTVITPPPKPGVTLKDLNLSSDGCDSGSGSSSSGSSGEESSDSEGEVDDSVKQEREAPIAPPQASETMA